MDAKLYRQLMGLDTTVFESGNFDSAYHILMAALHCASGDLAALGEVRERALNHLAEIDARHPEYDHSSVSAKKRGHISIYEMLAEQAKAMVVMARQAKRAER